MSKVLFLNTFLFFSERIGDTVVWVYNVLLDALQFV
jgi:hypothetical protein